MSEEQMVTYELDGEIALVGLNRPDKKNCFNPEVSAQLRDGHPAGRRRGQVRHHLRPRRQLLRRS